MKSLLACCSLILALSATQAHATNISGTWVGSGSAVDNQGKVINCENVSLVVQQTATSFSVNSSFTCGGMPIAIPGGVMEIRGGELFDKGVKAGTISDSSVTVTAKA